MQVEVEIEALHLSFIVLSTTFKTVFTVQRQQITIDYNSIEAAAYKMMVTS